MTKIVVFAPHPDDETLGCGGSIAHHTNAGRQVDLVFLTSGDQGVTGMAGEQATITREQEALDAAARLGVPGRRVHFLRLPDGGLRPWEPQQFLQVLQVVRQVRPQTVYLPHAADASWDHQQAFHLIWRCLEKCASRSYPQAGAPHWVETVLGYEVWSPVAAPGYLQALTPAEVAAKRAALGCYLSQIKGEGEADYAGDGGLAMARFRGAMSTGGHREAFTVLRVGTLFP